ncbi:P-selectin-like isoform X2 [Stegodyphus dumicola]|uniref:P-selectin-like isoform X2 n=1 Tax=Stegodyphus dumicola TaxID=202533 RepID=UPI0015AFE336|nr:P-selectin-like isoform X2 [Stegodyphus dumicola]
MDSSALVLNFVTMCMLYALWGTSGQRQCPRLQKPWNGQFVGSCDRYSGAECVFECRDPYVLVGSRVRVCRSDGTWSGQTAACELDGCGNCGCRNCGGGSCPALHDPDNGYTEGQCNPGIVGQTCLYRCSRGYSLEGQSRLTCLTSGQWNALPPYCRRTSAAICESIVIHNGYVRCAAEGGLTVCRVTCDNAYMLVGSSIVTCSPSGDWSDQIPTCRRTGNQVANICPTLVAPDGGRLVGSCTAASVGDTCQLVCISGFRPTDTRVLICQANGVWSNDLPQCIGTISGCPAITVDQGIVSETCSTGTTGQICTITCQSGYTLTGGSGTLVCQANGQWSGTLPICTAVSCPTLLAPASGSISGTCNPGASGQTCYFYCDAGYRLVGQSSLVCGSDGRWSGRPPYCMAASCPALYRPENGALSGSCTDATMGSICSFSCQAGYTLNGPSTLYCQDGGVWSGTAPSCVREAARSCESLNIPSNGFYLGTCAPGQVGQTCVFSCESGYELRGQRTLTCGSNGQWSSEPPRCERSGGGDNGDNGNGDDGNRNCPVLTPPPNSEFTECDNRPGGRCVVVCQSGYQRSGSRVRTCLSQGTWSGFAPTCTKTNCCP